jgi:NTP pyrophosphatase (non-canonical NTP hydrolase)
MQNEVYEELAISFFTPGHRHHDALEKGLKEEVYEVLEANAHGTREGLLDELGDVLWYITVMAKYEGSSLTELMEINRDKLTKREFYGK